MNIFFPYHYSAVNFLFTISSAWYETANILEHYYWYYYWYTPHNFKFNPRCKSLYKPLISSLPTWLGVSQAAVPKVRVKFRVRVRIRFSNTIRNGGSLEWLDNGMADWNPGLTVCTFTLNTFLHNSQVKKFQIKRHAPFTDKWDMQVIKDGVKWVLCHEAESQLSTQC